MRLTTVLAAALCLAGSGSAHAVDAPLESLSRFIAKHYCPEQPLVSREITYTAPLNGEETVFVHFTWKVTSIDQYGRSKGDDLIGVVRFSPTGRVEQLVIGGRLVAYDHLRHLRQAIKAARGWPATARSTAFGPKANPDEIGTSAARDVGELLGMKARVDKVQFHVLNSIGEPDGTWHIELKTVHGIENTIVRARIEPFMGKVIEVDASPRSDAAGR